MNTPLKPGEYATLPLEEWTITDLTDALTVPKSVELLQTTPRAIYTMRNTNVMHPDRIMLLIDAVRDDEPKCRQRLVVKRNGQFVRASNG